MERLWAPWRMDYVQGPRGSGCFLCANAAGQDDRETLVLLRGSVCALVMNRYPYTNGHLMVMPYRHIDRFESMTRDENLEMMELTARGVELLRKVIKPQGFNIGMNLGDVAGAGLKDHIHMHIVPRWQGDTNYMAVIADIRVIPQSLLELYDQLRAVITAKKD